MNLYVGNETKSELCRESPQYNNWQKKKIEKCFQVGDKIGIRINLDDGSLKFYKNGQAMDVGFPAGTISGPVVGAVELLTVGQALTLVPEAPSLS